MSFSTFGCCHPYFFLIYFILLEIQRYVDVFDEIMEIRQGGGGHLTISIKYIVTPRFYKQILKFGGLKFCYFG